MGLSCIADPCASFDCVYGTCAIAGSTPACVCDPGYGGAHCETCGPGYHEDLLGCVPDTPCTDAPCAHGQCSLTGNGFLCDCAPGYDGDLCDRCADGYQTSGLRCVRDSACDPDPCVHGSCVVANNSALCECDTGYTGETCAACANGYVPSGLFCRPEGTDPCAPNPCTTEHRTSCQADGDGYRCLCDSGYHLDALDVCVASTPCSPNPCIGAHAHVCNINGSGHTCSCDPGYHDEGGACAIDTVCDAATTCAGHGTCTGQGLTCQCDTSYTGTHCSDCATGYQPVGNLCLSVAVCDPNPCTADHRTVCTPQGAAYACSCNAGYQDSDGNETCLPDCATAALSCGAHAECQIVQGEAKCACAVGYQDNDRNGSCQPTCATAGLSCTPPQQCADSSGTAQCSDKPPVYVSFHWHMHQPIYWPYENIKDTEANNRTGYSVYAIHNDRAGNYTTWPRGALDKGRDMAHFGAQVSFSGSLIENLNNMAAAGAGFNNWSSSYREANGWKTANNNPRLDIVNFGYHHPLMGLIDTFDIRLQLQAHKLAANRAFGSTSKGLFPPECAFSQRMIPALVAEGIQWSLVDSLHFDRARADYPWRTGFDLLPPNASDQLVTAPSVQWWRPTKVWTGSDVSAPWAYQPHWVEYTDPATGAKSRVIGVPAARYEGHEDGRNALKYVEQLPEYEKYNTDPQHPMLVVLHHDGDNYGMKQSSYWNENFQVLIDFLRANPTRFVETTIQDYLDQFPPDANDVVHVEDGAWSGADNGDPEFLKWNGAPAADGYSPDRNSWAIMTAAKNRVSTAEAITAHSSIQAIVDAGGNDTDKAWHYLLNGETSCYWYWDNTEDGRWDSHPARAANMAVDYADKVISGRPDTVGPTIYLPQRTPYNPGLNGAATDVIVWTFVYDVSNVSQVTLNWRVDGDGKRDGANDLFAGGTWTSASMAARTIASRTNPLPKYKADEYSATISAGSNKLVDYYVSASDGQGNETKSPIRHVFIGSSAPPPQNIWTPAAPTKSDTITITWTKACQFHWGINKATAGVWVKPPEEYWPSGTVAYSDGKSVETPLAGPDGQGNYTVQIGPFNKTTTVSEVDFIFHCPNNVWEPGDRTIPITN